MTPTVICETCQNGCDCTAEDQACEHFGCWGRESAVYGTCAGADHERDRVLALWLGVAMTSDNTLDGEA